MTDRAIKDLRNLGPKMQLMLTEIEVSGEQDLREMGALEAYRRLRFRFSGGVSIIALYAMEAALVDRDWRDLSPATKADLRRKVDAL